MSTEAQKEASRRYYLKHKDYYKQKAIDDMKGVRIDKKKFKQRLDKATNYIKDNFSNSDGTIWNSDMKDLLDILQGEE